jgi:glycerate-2-kinase
MVKGKEINIITSGQITLEDKRNYAKAMARALMAEYGKEICEKVLDKLKKI